YIRRQQVFHKKNINPAEESNILLFVCGKPQFFISMKTKAQKSAELQEGKKLLSASKNVVFADFTGIGIELLKRLKKELKKNGATFRVLKKRLLRIAMKESGFD